MFSVMIKSMPSGQHCFRPYCGTALPLTLSECNFSKPCTLKVYSNIFAPKFADDRILVPLERWTPHQKICFKPTFVKIKKK